MNKKLQNNSKNEKKLPISYLKYKDLKKLCVDGTIPKRFHKDYLEMPYSNGKEDTLIETDEEDIDCDEGQTD